MARAPVTYIAHLLSRLLNLARFQYTYAGYGLLAVDSKYVHPVTYNRYYLVVVNLVRSQIMYARNECRKLKKKQSENEKKAQVTEFEEAEFSLAANTSLEMDSILFTSWYPVSGASEHMICATYCRILTNIHNLPSPANIKLAKSGKNLKATEVDDLCASFEMNGKINVIKLRSILIVPGLRHNLLSVRRLDSNGCKLIFEEGIPRIPNELLKGKLNKCTQMCIVVGYCPYGYKMWNPITRKIVLAYDVFFDENVTWSGENMTTSPAVRGMNGLKKGWFSELSSLWPGISQSLEVSEVLHSEKSDFQDILVLQT
uniref:PABS domain-containing protein n=1 Tax=Timema douglasi TaxID=61478 RepID=A0A7R8VFS8_TIMDO|nr:unnamed protein product [Timema douglasi]